MTADQLRDAGIKLFGERAWQSALAKQLGIDRATVWRYMNTGIVPGPVAAAVECWLRSTPPAAAKEE